VTEGDRPEWFHGLFGDVPTYWVPPVRVRVRPGRHPVVVPVSFEPVRVQWGNLALSQGERERLTRGLASVSCGGKRAPSRLRWEQSVEEFEGISVSAVQHSGGKPLLVPLAEASPEDVWTALSRPTWDWIGIDGRPPRGARWKMFELPPVVQAAPMQRVAVTTIRWPAQGPHRPPWPEALLVGFALRQTLSMYVERAGYDPSMLVGRDPWGVPLRDGHQHPFCLPEDADDDGVVDHVVLFVPGGLECGVYEVAERLNSLRIGRVHWGLDVPRIGLRASDTGTVLAGPSRMWMSWTPYLHPWHRHRSTRFGAKQQLAKELTERGLPQPTAIEAMPPRLGARGWWPSHFRRVRPGARWGPPDAYGTAWKITFPYPVDGPIALGAGCHDGLGLFRPADAG
jgi:CRISPR-associated protein Csb2